MEAPVCVLEPGAEVRVWARSAPGADIQLRTIPPGDLAAGESRADGRLFRIRSPQVELLELQATRGGTTASFALLVEQWPRPGFFQEARALARSGQLQEARSLVESHLESSFEERWHGMALGLLARLEQEAGRPVQALELLHRAISEHRRRGDIGEEIADRCLSIHISFSDLGDFRTALQELKEMPQPPLGDADAAYLQAYYRGTLAVYNGDFRDALVSLNTARDQREHLADAVGVGVISQVLPRVLQRLGRADEARDLFERLTSDSGYLEQLSGCQRATLFNNVAWDRILKLEAGSPAEDPLPLLEKALEALSEGPSCRTTGRASIHINLGFADLHLGDPVAAEQHLEAARVDLGTASPRLLLWHLDLESRLDEGRGRFERAAHGFWRLQGLAEAALSPEAQWRALFGQARVAKARGRPQEALRAYAHAERLLDEISLRSPVGLGRATSMVAIEGSTRSYLHLLLDLGLHAEALGLARRSRSRVQRGLIFKGRVAGLGSQERLEWSRHLAHYESLAAEFESTLAGGWEKAASHRKGLELRRRRQREELRQSLDQAFALLDSKGLAKQGGSLVAGDGEVILLYHPIVDGWVGFAIGPGSMKVERLGNLSQEQPRDELANRLLGPFREQLSVANLVRVLSYGWLRGVDFHALPVDGAHLLTKASVVYGLDLPEVPASSAAVRRRQALVVADPTETLSAAGREATIVADHFRRRELVVEWLAGGAANRRRVLEGLDESTVFHFAGHAEIGDGLAGALRLADAGQLSVGDVLASSSVPESVVLAACDSGRPARTESGPSLSLAEAFLIAGSREVLSTSRAIDDRAATAMVVAVYRHWRGDVPLAEALRRAQLEPEIFQRTDWAAFRVLGR